MAEAAIFFIVRVAARFAEISKAPTKENNARQIVGERVTLPGAYTVVFLFERRKRS